MKIIYTYSLLALMMLGLVFSAKAQIPNVDICLRQKDNTTLAVSLATSINFTGIVSNLQFTIRWNDGTGAGLGNPVFLIPTNTVVSINKAGVETPDGTFRYQKFFSGGLTPMSATGQQLSSTHLDVLEIKAVDGTGTPLPITTENFVIGNDAFSNTVNFNGVYYAELGGGDKTGTIVACGPQVLPVEGLHFAAEKVNEHDVLVSWVTSTEINNDFFVVEKKRNKGEFAPIGKVMGHGTTSETHAYELLDESGMSTVNSYRLKQFDLDGSFTYSEIVEINFDVYDNDKFVVFPSPANESATLQATGKLDGDYRYSISDAAGKIVFKGVLVKNSPTGAIQINLTHYAEGIYFIRLVSPTGKSYLNRLVKIKE